MAWKPIVVGLDVSPEAARAATFGGGMAQLGATRCQLVHATRDALGSVYAPEGSRYRHALLGQARAQVVAALRDAVPATLLDGLAVRSGATVAVLRQAVRELGAELLVLGGKHHSTLGRWLGGSTSLDAARITDLPLLVTAGMPGAIRRILAALDLSGAARATLETAERYAHLFGAELRALHVLEPLPVISDGTPAYDPTEYYGAVQEALARDVWPLIPSDGVEKIVRHGEAVETITREAIEWPADLLVVGSHGKGKLERIVLGSVTERLLNHLPTSLLVVPVLTPAVPPPVGGQAAQRQAAVPRA